MLPYIVNLALHRRLRSFPLTQLQAIPVSDSSAHSAFPRWTFPSPALFSPLVTRHSPLTPLDSALTDSRARKSFRIRSYEKKGGRGGSTLQIRLRISVPGGLREQGTSLAIPQLQLYSRA